MMSFQLPQLWQNELPSVALTPFDRVMLEGMSPIYKLETQLAVWMLDLFNSLERTFG